MNLKPLITELNGKVCPTHNKHPEITQTGDDVKMKTCCEEFRSTLLEDYKTGLREAGRKAILAAFKKK